MRNSVTYNMAVLTASGMVTKTIDFAFRTYYSKHLGAEGMGVFSLIMSAFGVILSLSSAGMGIAVSRLVSISEERGNKNEGFAIVKAAVMVAFSISAVCISIVFVFAEWISGFILGDERCVAGLLCIVPASLFMGVSYCIKGYFYGTRQIFIPASSEFVEQAVKIISIIFFLDRGLYMGVEYGCAGVLLGLTVGELSSCLYLCIFYGIKATRTKERFPVKEILKITAPVATSAVGNSFFRMIEDVKIIEGLERYGEENAVGTYGMIRGMAMPLIVFPLTLISSFVSLLIPEVSRATEKGGLKRIVGKVERVGALFGLLIFAVFFCFAEDITFAVYGAKNISGYVRILSVLCPVMVIDSLSTGILGGLGEQRRLMQYSFADTALRLSVVFCILPFMGSYAIIIMTFLSNILTCFLTTMRVRKKVRRT